MTFVGALARMRASLYSRLGVAIVWTPAGGSPVELLALPGLGDAVAQIDGLGGMVAPLQSVRVRHAQIVELGGGSVPMAGDGVTITDPETLEVEAFVISGQPRREDRRRREWTLDLARG